MEFIRRFLGFQEQNKIARTHENIDPEQEAELKARIEKFKAQEQLLSSGEIKNLETIQFGSKLILFATIDGTDGAVFKDIIEDEGIKDSHIAYERVGYLLSQYLGFTFVPPTIIRQVEDKRGSLQLFIPDAPTGNELSRDDKLLREELRLQINALLVFDFLLQNHDRHGGNWLLRDGKIVAIDNGGSFRNQIYFSPFGEMWDFRMPLQYDLALQPQLIRSIIATTSQPDFAHKLRKDLQELLGKERITGLFERIKSLISILKRYGKIPKGTIINVGRNLMEEPK